MGSGSKRKSNDRVLINTPLNSYGPTGAGGNQPTRDVNNLCPAFRVKLEKQNIPVGSELIAVNGNSIQILGKDIEVCRLTKTQVERTKNCLRTGISYSIKVTKEKDGLYADFLPA